MVSATSSMLAANIRDFQVTYGNRLFNHLSISISALHYLDASDAQLSSFYQHYTQRLIEQSAHQQIQNPIAQQSEALFIYYQSQLQQQGIEQTLRQELANLIPGIVAGGFYALNRLASGIELKNVEEIAAALTYWRIYYLDLGTIACVDKSPPTKILRQLAKVIGHIRFPAGNTCDRIKTVKLLEAFQMSAHQPIEISIEIVADATIKIYQMSGDFTMLHAFTGAAALRVILPFCQDEELALRYFWQAVVASYLSTGSAPMVPTEKSPLMPWTDIFSFCHQTNNECLIELCRACHQLDDLLAHDRCHQVASRQVLLHR